MLAKGIYAASLTACTVPASSASGAVRRGDRSPLTLCTSSATTAVAVSRAAQGRMQIILICTVGGVHELNPAGTPNTIRRIFLAILITISTQRRATDLRVLGAALGNRTPDLPITSVFACIARGFKARASFMFVGCCCWRSSAADGRSAAPGGTPRPSDPHRSAAGGRAD